MIANEKLRNWIDNKGFKRGHIAKKLGMTQPMLSEICRSTCGIPRRYWKLVMLLTEGLITLEDLANLEHIENK